MIIDFFVKHDVLMFNAEEHFSTSHEIFFETHTRTLTISYKRLENILLH